MVKKPRKPVKSIKLKMAIARHKKVSAQIKAQSTSWGDIE